MSAAQAKRLATIARRKRAAAKQARQVKAASPAPRHKRSWFVKWQPRIPSPKASDVSESHVETKEGSRSFDKRDREVYFDKDSRKWKRTVFGKFASYTWELDTVYEAQALLVQLNAKYDGYRVPGTTQRVVCRMEVGYHTEDPSAKTWVSSPYDWTADVNLYAHSWEEKSSSQVMLQSLDDRSKLRFIVELLLPFLAVEEFGEPDA